MYTVLLMWMDLTPTSLHSPPCSQDSPLQSKAPSLATSHIGAEQPSVSGALEETSCTWQCDPLLAHEQNTCKHCRITFPATCTEREPGIWICCLCPRLNKLPYTLWGHHGPSGKSPPPSLHFSLLKESSFIYVAMDLKSS